MCTYWGKHYRKAGTLGQVTVVQRMSRKEGKNSRSKVAEVENCHPTHPAIVGGGLRVLTGSYRGVMHDSIHETPKKT